MQRNRLRKSRTASGTEGIPRAQKQKGESRSYVDYWSLADGIIHNDMKSLEPVRKLRAEELSEEAEPKRRSPNVIARLMGLEALPSPRNVKTRQERATESHQHDYCRSVETCSSSKHLEFKDVYEDLEAAARVTNRSCSSKGQAQPILVEAEIACVRDKFKASKHLFADENFKYAANERDVCSNPRDSPDDNLLVQYLQPADNTFLKQMHFSEAQLGSYIAVLKPEKYQQWRLARDASSCRHGVMPRTKRVDGLLLEPDSQHRARVSRKSLRGPLEDTDVGNILSLPTRIVVLKPNVGGGERTSRGKKEPYRNVGPSWLTSNESREVARKIARKMRKSYDATKAIKSSRFFGYAGDESSYDPDETDSDSESEVITLSYTKSINDSNFSRYSSPTLVAQSSYTEAKKRLPEKLKAAEKYQNLETHTKGTTLGEMLSLPDVDSRPKHLHTKGLGKQNAAPIGISCSDGWPNEALLLSSSSNRRGKDRSEFCEERNPLHLDSSPRIISKSCGETLIEETGSSSDAIKTQMEATTRDILEGPQTCKNHEALKLMEKHNHHQDSPSSHHLGVEPESSAGTKEDNADDHHSPISILEVPLVEDPPFSESFERVSADLHELRKQLHLLKMESGSFTDSSTLDEADQTSPTNASERNHTQEFASENWETPHGLEEYNLDEFMTTWDIHECPLDPKLLFDELKKKYINEMGSSRSERRLLFDLINMQISEIFRNYADLYLYPWVTPKVSGSCPKSRDEAVRGALEELINRGSSIREMLQWPDMKGEVNAIGNEIANLLVDDMIGDVVI